MLGQIANAPDAWQHCQAFNVAGHGDAHNAAGMYGLGADGQQPQMQQQMQPGFPAIQSSGNKVLDSILAAGVVGSTIYLQSKQAKAQAQAQLAAQHEMLKQQQAQQQRSSSGGAGSLLMYGGIAVGISLLGLIIYKVTKRKPSSSGVS